MKVDNISGSISDVNLSFEYHPWNHVGFGLGYNSYGMTINLEESTDSFFDFKGKIKSGYTGLNLYVKVFF